MLNITIHEIHHRLIHKNNYFLQMGSGECLSWTFELQSKQFCVYISYILRINERILCYEEGSYKNLYIYKTESQSGHQDTYIIEKDHHPG